MQALAGTLLIERAIARIGHKDAFVVFERIHCNDPVLPLIPHQAVWRWLVLLLVLR